MKSYIDEDKANKNKSNGTMVQSFGIICIIHFELFDFHYFL